MTQQSKVDVWDPMQKLQFLNYQTGLDTPWRITLLRKHCKDIKESITGIKYSFLNFIKAYRYGKFLYNFIKQHMQNVNLIPEYEKLFQSLGK